MRNLICATVMFSVVLASSAAFSQDGEATDTVAIKKPVSHVSKDFKTIPFDASKEMKRSASEILRKLRKGFESGDQALFDKVCDNYVLAMWTQPENHPELATLRGQFRSKLESCKGSPATRRHFNDHLLKVLPKMAADDYHPAVRYNCMMLLGELDEKPAMRIGDTATPLPAALPILLEAATDVNQIDAVKLAALLGIYRHSYKLTEPAARNNVSKAMSTLATTKNAPGTSKGGQSWMRCIAIDTLGRLKSVGNNGATANLLLEIVDDKGNPFRVRVAAARAVGNLTYPPGAAGLKPDAMVRQLGRMAMDACEKEIEECKEKDRTISPRKLKNRLIAARIGLMGTDDLRAETPTGGAMSLVEKSEVKKNADKIRDQIDRWIGLLDDESLMKKVEPPQDPRARGMGMGGPGMGMGGPGMGGEMGMMGMGGRRPGAGGRPGTAEEDEVDEMKTASDEIIEKIKEDLKSFAVLVQ